MVKEFPFPSASEPGPAGLPFEESVIEELAGLMGPLWGEYRKMAFECQTTDRIEKNATASFGCRSGREGKDGHEYCLDLGDVFQYLEVQWSS